MSLKNNVKLIYKNRLQILEGIKNKVFKKESVEAIAEVRLQTCIDCELYDAEGTECLVPGTQPCCGDCGCSLSLKTRSLSSGCPKDKWAPVLTEEEELDHEILNPEPDDKV